MFRGKTLIALGTLAAAALLAAGCSGISSQFTADEPFSRSFDVSGAPRIIVETFNGSIDVQTGEAGQVDIDGTKRGSGASQTEAQADLKNVEVSMTQEGDTIRMVARRTDSAFNTGSSGASFDLIVPAGATLDLRSSNGGLASIGVTGDVTMRTSNGEIDVRGGAGRLDLQTSNGRIRIEAQDAAVDAHTSNGAIDFRGALADGEHVFDTSNGSLDITLPSDARFRIDADTSNGKVTTDFAVTVSGSLEDDQLKGTVGDNPSISIRATSSNGSISIRKGS